jgi:hypothetical protein
MDCKKMFYNDNDLIIEHEEVQYEDNFNPNIFTESHNSYVDNVNEAKEADILNNKSKIAKAFHLICCCKKTKDDNNEPIVINA